MATDKEIYELTLDMDDDRVYSIEGIRGGILGGVHLKGSVWKKIMADVIKLNEDVRSDSNKSE
jgi:hypothetical protein